LEHLKEHQIDLMLVDMRMPEMNGLEVIKTVKSTSPVLPIMVVTSHIDQEILDELSKLKVYDFIIKPFDLATLEKKIIAKLSAP
jgi:DNA-binding NtrC family response regulator